VFERVAGDAGAVETPIGYLPSDDDLDTTGLEIRHDDLEVLLSVDSHGWQAAIPEIRAHYDRFGEALPEELLKALDQLESNLSKV